MFESKTFSDNFVFSLESAIVINSTVDNPFYN